MKKIIIFILCLSLTVWANYPPTTTKLQGESTPTTTFNFGFPYFTGTRSGTTTNLGTLSVAGGGTGATGFTAGSVLFSDGTNITQNNSAFFWDNTNARLGINTTTPSYALDITDNSTAAFGASITRTGTQSNALAGQNITVNQTTTTSGAYSTKGLSITLNKKVSASQTDTSTNFGLNQSYVRNGIGTADNGTLTSLFGNWMEYGHVNVDATATPTTTNMYGIYVQPRYQRGTITNMYDFFINNASTGGTVVNRWGIYQQDNANNYLAGNLGVATNAPTYELSLGGGSARTLGVVRNPNSNSAGQQLTVVAGGSTLGGTNLAGGKLNLCSGVSTGTGDSSIELQTATAGSTGSSTNSTTTKMYILGNGNVGIGNLASNPLSLLQLSAPTNPTLRFSANASTTNLTTQYDDGLNAFIITKRVPTGNVNIYNEFNVVDGVSSANLYLFRNTNSSGSKNITLFLGNGTGTVDSNIGVGSNTYFNVASGNVGIATNSPQSNLHVNGSFQGKVTALTTTASLGTTDFYVTMSAASAGFTVTIPACTTSIIGRVYNLKKIDTTFNAITLTRSSTDVIDGATTVLMTTPYESKQLVCTSAGNWSIF